MTIVLSLLLIVYMGFFGRMSGADGTIFSKKFKVWKWEIGFGFVPEMLFALPFGVLTALMYAKMMSVDPSAWVGLFGWVWAWVFMETGHGVVLQWGDNPAAAQGTRTHKLQLIVNPLAERFGFTLGDRNYCRLFMAIKGFMIALPSGAGVPMLVLWPLGYEIGCRLRNRVSFDPHALAEIISCSGAAVAILIVGVLCQL